MEDIRFDRGSGQLLTGSFMDYAMPRADDLCAFDDEEQSGADQDQSAGRQGRGRGGLRRRAAGGGRTRSSMRCRCSASAMSRCRRRPSASGARCAAGRDGQGAADRRRRSGAGRVGGRHRAAPAGLRGRGLRAGVRTCRVRRRHQYQPQFGEILSRRRASRNSCMRSAPSPLASAGVIGAAARFTTACPSAISKSAMAPATTSSIAATCIACCRDAMPQESSASASAAQDVELRDGSVGLTFDDGTSAEADVAIGCDGIRSAVRSARFWRRGTALCRNHVLARAGARRCAAQGLPRSPRQPMVGRGRLRHQLPSSASDKFINFVACASSPAGPSRPGRCRARSMKCWRPFPRRAIRCAG